MAGLNDDGYCCMNHTCVAPIFFLPTCLCILKVHYRAWCISRAWDLRNEEGSWAVKDSTFLGARVLEECRFLVRGKNFRLGKNIVRIS